jgi:hypothetical protein
LTARPQARKLAPAAPLARHGTKDMRRIYQVSAVVLLGIAGAAGYYYYHLTCCAPPPIERSMIDQGK